MKNILIIAPYEKPKKYIKQLCNSALYKIKTIKNINKIDFETIQQFEIVIYYLLDNNTRETIANKIPNTLKIIEIYPQDAKCLFKNECLNCVDKGCTILHEPVEIDYLIHIINQEYPKLCRVYTKHHSIEYLQQLPLFQILQKKELETLKNNSTIREYGENSFVFYEGDKAENFYFLLEGSLKEYIFTCNNVDFIFNRFDGGFFCEAESFYNITFKTNIKALNHVTILSIKRDVMIDILSKNPLICFSFFQTIGVRYNHIIESVYKDKMFTTLEKTNLFLEENPNIMNYKTQQEISSQLGMAEATLSRNLTKLKKS